MGENKDRRIKMDTTIHSMTPQKKIHSMIYACKHLSDTRRAREKLIEWTSI